MTNLGEKIQKIRKENGMTQVDLGDKLCISAQAVSKWENNASEPDLDTLKKLCDLFGVSISYFIETEVSGGAPAREEIKEERAPREEVPPKIIVGYCSKCKRPIEGSEKYELDPLTNHLLCAKCHAQREMTFTGMEISDKKKSIKWGFFWGGLAAAVLLVIFIAAAFFGGEASGAVTAIVVGVILAYAGFAFITQLFMDGIVCDWMDFFKRSFQMPGLIFTFDLDGIMWLIGMKILFAVIAWSLSAICFIVGIVITSAFAMFSFPFAMVSYRNELSRARAAYATAKAKRDSEK